MAIVTMKSKSMRVVRNVGTDPDTGALITNTKSYNGVDSTATDDNILDVYDLITSLQDGAKAGCFTVLTNQLERS